MVFHKKGNQICYPFRTIVQKYKYRKRIKELQKEIFYIQVECITL